MPSVLAADRRRPRPAGSLRLEPSSEAGAFHEIGDQINLFVLHADIENRHEAWMLEPGDAACFLEELLHRGLLVATFEVRDFDGHFAFELRLRLYEELSNRPPKPFAWKFTRQDLTDWLKRASPHFLAASAA